MLRLVDCSRKQAYTTEWEAAEVAEHQMNLKPGLALRVYLCDGCGRYHLTHKARRF